MRLVGKPHRNAISTERPKLLDQSVFELARPLAREERNNLFTSVYKLSAIAPAAVNCISKTCAVRVASIPRVLGDAHLGDCGLLCEWRDIGTGCTCRHSRLLLY